jgi:hypothetical protein
MKTIDENCGPEPIEADDLVHQIHGQAGALFALMNQTNDEVDIDDPRDVALAQLGLDLWQSASALVALYEAGKLREVERLEAEGAAS